MLSNVGVILSLLVAFQMLFTSLFLFTHKKGNRTNNALLGIILLLFSLNMGDFTLRVSGYQFPWTILHLIDDAFFFLYGPLFYFYTIRLAQHEVKWRKQYLLHFILFGLFVLFFGWQFFLSSELDDPGIFEQVISGQVPWWIFLISSTIYLHIFVYLWMSWKLLVRYRRTVREQFSNLSKINLDWLEFLVRAFAVITAVALLHNLMPMAQNLTIYYGSILALLLFSLLFVNRILVKALNQPEIFSRVEEETRYATSQLQDHEIDAYQMQLVHQMESEKQYLNPDLTLKDLASQLDISARYLSQIINQRFDKNFFDFVNGYRCEEVKAILSREDDKFTIIEAMYQAGFNSKSSFNKEFKKLTGETPSTFRKTLKAEKVAEN